MSELAVQRETLESQLAAALAAQEQFAAAAAEQAEQRLQLERVIDELSVRLAAPAAAAVSVLEGDAANEELQQRLHAALQVGCRLRVMWAGAASCKSEGTYEQSPCSALLLQEVAQLAQTKQTLQELQERAAQLQAATEEQVAQLAQATAAQEAAVAEAVALQARFDVLASQHAAVEQQLLSLQQQQQQQQSATAAPTAMEVTGQSLEQQEELVSGLRQQVAELQARQAELEAEMSDVQAACNVARAEKHTVERATTHR